MSRSLKLFVFVYVSMWSSLHAFAETGPGGGRSLSMTKRQLGPIELGTRFNRQTFAKLLPGFTVVARREGCADSPGITYPVIDVQRGRRTVFTAVGDESEPGAIGAIRTTDKTVMAPRGIHVGDRFSKIYGTSPHAEIVECVQGLDDRRAMILCRDPFVENLSYWFSSICDREVAIDHMAECAVHDYIVREMVLGKPSGTALHKSP